MLVGTPAQTIAVVLAGHAKDLLPELAAAESTEVVQPPDLQLPTLPWSRRHWGRVGQKMYERIVWKRAVFRLLSF